MTRSPYGPDELDRIDPSLDRVADALERHATDTGAEPPAWLAQRIVAALDEEPEPVPGWWAGLVRGVAPWRGAARALAVAAVLIAAVTGGLAVRDLLSQQNLGPPPLPSVSPSPTPTPSPTPSPTESPTPSPSPSPSDTPPPSPSASEDELETPEPSESDDSGGSGGGDNSGPGGGGNSGSGGGGDNSGSGSGD